MKSIHTATEVPTPVFFGPNIPLQTLCRALPIVDFIVNYIQQTYYINQISKQTQAHFHTPEHTIKNLVHIQNIQASCSLVKAIASLAIAILFPSLATWAFPISAVYLCSSACNWYNVWYNLNQTDILYRGYLINIF